MLVGPPAPLVAPVSPFVDALLRAARATIGWREEAPNDAPFIRTWLAAVGVHKPAPWCMAGVYAWFQAAAEACGVSNPCPRTASSQTFWAAVPEHQRHHEPLPGDVAAFRSVTDHARGHVALVEYNLVTLPGHVHTIEGNSNAAGSRNGDRVAEHDWAWASGRRGGLELLGFARLI